MVTNVVLPAPFGPIRPWIVCAVTSNETWLTARSAPYDFVTPEIRRIGVDRERSCGGRTSRRPRIFMSEMKSCTARRGSDLADVSNFAGLRRNRPLTYDPQQRGQ